MILKLVTPPATEPLDLETEVKTHLRVDIADDDDIIGALITAAREYVEAVTGRALIMQTWRLSLACWPVGDEIVLPRPPLQAVTSLKYFDADGGETTWSSSNYLVDTDSEPGRVVLANNVSWPNMSLRNFNPIQITYVVGYGGAADVPQHLKQALLLLIGHWYENRESVTIGQQGREVPLAVESLLWLNRVF